jgi:hypothetical protein
LGKVVATFENAVSGGPSVKPMLKAGEKVHEVDVAENYKLDINAFLQAAQPVIKDTFGSCLSARMSEMDRQCRQSEPDRNSAPVSVTK